MGIGRLIGKRTSKNRTMESSDKVIAKIPGIFTIVSAVAMAVFHALQGHQMDSYILPFILLVFGISILLRKPEEEIRGPRLEKSTRRLVLVALSISLVAGIMVMVLTLV